MKEPFERDSTLESIVLAESRTVGGEAKLKWSHNITLFCTLSHTSYTIDPTNQRTHTARRGSPTLGHSKSHIRTHLYTIYALSEYPAAGPMCITSFNYVRIRRLDTIYMLTRY